MESFVEDATVSVVLCPSMSFPKRVEQSTKVTLGTRSLLALMQFFSVISSRRSKKFPSFSVCRSPHIKETRNVFFSSNSNSLLDSNTTLVCFLASSPSRRVVSSEPARHDLWNLLEEWSRHGETRTLSLNVVEECPMISSQPRITAQCVSSPQAPR